MKKMIRNALMICLGIGLMGCEWQGGGDGTSWNSRYNFVNFSGSYRGSPLVSAYSSTGGGGGTTAGGESYVNRSESQSRNVQLQSVVAGQMTYTPVVPGSVSITAFGDLGGNSVGFSVSDDGSGNLAGANFTIPYQDPVSVSGKIVYNTGAWYINFGGNASLAGTMDFTETYSQSIAAGSTGASSGTPGSTKVTIYAFNVAQEGNKLVITDNNGSIYNGSFGSIRTTSGVDQDTVYPQYSNGDQVMGQFEAKGRSAANIDVKMIGTFQATISGVSASTTGTTTMQLTGRQILGTWIESGGATGDINGQAASISVSTTTDTTTTTTP